MALLDLQQARGDAMTRKTWTAEAVSEISAFFRRSIACGAFAGANSEMDDAAEMLDAFAASLRQTQWQPIETAPPLETVVVGGPAQPTVAYKTDPPLPLMATWRNVRDGKQLESWPGWWAPLPPRPAGWEGR